jgi:hypothetical protein
MNITHAFAKYGARPKNARWSVSAFAEDGSLVVSLWQHHFGKSANGVLPYVDRLSRWRGPGNDLLREHLQQAQAADAPVRAIIASTPNPELVDAGEDGSKIKKEFHLLERLVGRVVEFDGDAFVLHFAAH